MNPSEKSKSKRLRVVKSEQASPTPVADPNSTAESSCPHCFGTGMEVVPGEGARRCRCQSPDHRQRLFQAARIPARYQHCTLQGYDAGDSDSKWIAKIEADRVINDYPVIDGCGLVFVGAVGVGKTHLAVALLQELIQRYQVRGLFYQFGALLRRIQDSYNPVSKNSELAVLE